MIELLEWVWLVSVLILTGYQLVIFRRRPEPLRKAVPSLPGVSVVIAHKNDAASLEQNLSAIAEQDYPEFEVIIVDDHSAPAEKEILEIASTKYPNVNFILSDGDGKKQALKTGISRAKFELILCTDADCKPQTPHWIRKMVQAGKGNDIILGYSPHKKLQGWLNRFIRFETTLTAIQYLSWASAGRAYMAVGRNMLYPRKIFLEGDPYKNHESIPYGDDDLFVQAMVAKTPVRICDDPQAHVVTGPVTSWPALWKQKHRHMSAAHHYKKKLWWQPGLYGVSLVVHWFLLLGFLFILPWWKWLPVFLIGLFIRWITYIIWTNKLGEKDTIAWFPFLEIQYAAYLAVMGFYTLFNKKKAWN